MRKSSTNQLTVLNALASFLYNSMLEKLRATMGYYSLNTPVMLSSQTSTRCYLWSSFTSLLIFTWWILFFFLLYFILQYCIGFGIHWHESATGVHELPTMNPPPTSHRTSSLWIIPVHQPQASCIEQRLVIHFLHDSIHVSMPFSQIIPYSPSPQSPKVRSTHLCLFCCFAYRVIITILLNSIYTC